MLVSDPCADEINESRVNNPTSAKNIPRISSLRSSDSRFHEKEGREEERRLRLERAAGARLAGVEVFLGAAPADFDRLLEDRLPLVFVLREGDFATDLLR